MRGFVSVICCLLFVASAYAGLPSIVFTSNITSNNFTGIEVIVLDGPSWATQIENSFWTHEFFVYGDKTLRTIHIGGGQEFYAEPDSDPLSYPLIDLHTFYFFDNTTSNFYKITLGVTENNAYDAADFVGVTGNYLPLFSASLNLNNTGATSTLGLLKNSADQNHPNAPYNADISGFMAAAVRVDSFSTYPINIAYYAGFQSNENGTNFILLRTYYNVATSGGINPQGGAPFTFKPSIDVFPIYQNSFTTYNEAYKPWIHILNYTGGANPSGTDIVIIVDPNTFTVYAVDTTKEDPVTYRSLMVSDNNKMYDMVSSAYDYMTGKLVVGFANTAFGPGFVQILDLNSVNGNIYNIPAPVRLNLPGNYSNPKALALDWQDRALYIGLNGDSHILKYNMSTSAWSYQTLPDFLHRSWDATVTIFHVYFVTYEQNSKVFRVGKDDFCSTACPWMGYCHREQCKCYEGFEFNKEKNECLLTAAVKETIYETKYHRAHGGEIALGILWALTLIAAAGGWYLWWKGRRGAYQAV